MICPRQQQHQAERYLTAIFLAVVVVSLTTKGRAVVQGQKMEENNYCCHICFHIVRVSVFFGGSFSTYLLSQYERKLEKEGVCARLPLLPLRVYFILLSKFSF